MDDMGGYGGNDGGGGEISHSRSFVKVNNNVKAFFFDMFTYSTVRSATIKSKRVGVAYRLVQFLLLFYIIGWDLFYKKGYQEFDSVSSVVTTKVKGQGFVPVNATIDRSISPKDPQFLQKTLELDPNKTYKILDTADYIVPPNEYNSIFIMSNYIQTIQTQGVCDEEVSKLKAECTKDEDCQNLGTFMNAWNGIPTGRCIPSSMKANRSTCEVKGWCPTEHDSDRHEDSLIRNVLNYTIFIKNDIEFKKFRKKQRNIAPNITNKYISQCTYEDRRDNLCPVFQLNYILSKAEPDPMEKYKMLMKGGVVVVEIIWNCDFDFNSECFPKYVFNRFDTKETNTASGFNFRFANKFNYDGKEQRVLYKAYGIRIIINVSGTAGKFAIIPLMMTIGTGFGLMSISVIVADCVMLHCTKKKSLYQKIKEFDLKEKETMLNEMPDGNDGDHENNNNNNNGSTLDQTNYVN